MPSSNPQLAKYLDTLKPRVRKFVEALLQGKTQKESAIEAGYSKANAESQGSKLARNAKVLEALKLAGEKSTEVALAGRERWLAEVRSISYAKLEGEEPDTAELIATAEGKPLARRVKDSTKVKALELEGKAEKYITDDKVVEHKLGLRELLALGRAVREARKGVRR